MLQPVAECLLDPPPPFSRELEKLQEFHALLPTCLGRLKSYAYPFVSNPADAEDAVQDALYSAYKHLGGFKGECQMTTWLVAIVRNCARMSIRGNRAEHVSLDQASPEGEAYSLAHILPDHGLNPEQEYRQLELQMQMARLVGTLPSKQRQVIQLRHMEGHSIQSIAKETGLSIGAVKSQLCRARKRLRHLFERESRRPRAQTRVE